MQKNRLKSVQGISWETTKMVKFWLIGTEGVRSTYNSAGNMVVSIIANGVSLERQLVDFGVGITVSRRCLVCDLQIRDYVMLCHVNGCHFSFDATTEVGPPPHLGLTMA